MALVAEPGSYSGKEQSPKTEGSLPLPAARAAPIAESAGPRALGRPWTEHSPASQPTRVFPVPLDRQFPSEPRLTSPSDCAEYSMIFNYRKSCWGEGR